jgi:GNAT superfamily N-acetyltransferase
MIHRLDEQAYTRVCPLFADWTDILEAQAVLDGTNPGFVYVDDPVAPRTAVLWALPDIFYLAGVAGNHTFNRAFAHWIEAEIRPRARETGLTFFAVQPLPLERWAPLMPVLLGSYSYQINYARYFAFDRERYAAAPPARAVPAGVAVRPIDSALLQVPAVAGRVGRYWRSPAEFLAAGLGFCAMRESEVLSICLTARCSGGRHDISIITLDHGARRQGYGEATARAFIDECLRRGDTPSWNADGTNTASIALAGKLGFTKVREAPDFWFLF